MSLPDHAARRRALSALDESLLVEAAAGTGKTALMAGRVALLLASGAPPSSIAAITFTELAAGELASRIRHMVESLLRGDIPQVLKPALPDGPSPAQLANLRAAAARLDELTAATIHGFCQGLIRAYAVEADLDPGAAVMDGPQADAMFDACYSNWLRRRLGDDEATAGPIGVLATEEPLQVVETLRQLAGLRRGRPTARPLAVDLSQRADLDFREAVEAFERWFVAVPGEPRTAEILGGLRDLANSFGDHLQRPCSFETLWRLARPQRTSFMKGKTGLAWRAYAFKGAWRGVAGANGASFFDEALGHYEVCRTTFATLIGHLAGALIAEVSAALDEVLADYAARKRAAAALDFDDLLLRARSLVRDHDEVRRALGGRYRHIFVDEFQDTDPIQAEIIFALAADVFPAVWTQAEPRAGSLFLVGDPKQAIYRFRGAHVAAYAAVRDMFLSRDPESVVQITANFRSARPILDHVNARFGEVLEREGQPGYVALAATVDAPEGGSVNIAKLTVETPPDTPAGALRDAEAARVAEVCRRSVGTILVRRPDGMRTPLKPGDIALLAPTGTELWRYERALEAEGLSVASQAGKTLMRRQETQDVLALLRTLADPFDTLAFGAFMRGPVVGLSERRLLAVSAALPMGDDGAPSAFTVQTDPAHVQDVEARSALLDLQHLRRRAATTTPAVLLAEAIERLNLKVVLALRTGDRGGRAIANLDALLSLARAYQVRGLAAFVADLGASWAERRAFGEGRIDESEGAVSLVTIHSAKGLEWPVVIPINTATQLRGPDQFVHRQSDNTLHWLLGDLIPPHLADAQAEEAQSAARERERLWYVALTRARDLLVIPHLTGAHERSWSRMLDLTSNLPEFEVPTAPLEPAHREPPPPNLQTPEIFAAEAAAVEAASPTVVWRRPSDHDPDRLTLNEVATADTIDDTAEALEPISGAGRIRGVLLHKLIEEMLTGELEGDDAGVAARAAELADQLAADTPLDASECAATALRARSLPGIAPLWASLAPEVSIYAMAVDGAFVAGRADAVAITDGRLEALVDWKSDVEPSAAERAAHLGQVAAYLTATGASRGAVVYLTRGEVVWVERSL